jgi:hypothetical protein
MARVRRAMNPTPFQDAFSDLLVSDRFGEATTHWRKLEDRVRRGMGNRCPLVPIKFPFSIIRFR